MASNISLRKTKDSTDNPNEDKPLTGDKTLGIDPYIHLYETEDGNNTKEGE